MGVTKTIGRNDTNDVVINKPDIGRNHARITFDGKTNFFVEDLDSLNCTYVNNQPVKTATITLKDQLRLSKDTVIDISKIFGLQNSVAIDKKNQKDFIAEFESLKKVFEEYETKKIQMTKEEQRKSAKLRAAVTLTPLALWFILNNLPGVNTTKMQGGYIYISGILATVGNVMIGNRQTLVEKQMELSKNFQLSYVCPSCFTSLGNYSWEYWERKGNCPVCQAIYSKSKL
jgi:FHA domain